MKRFMLGLAVFIALTACAAPAWADNDGVARSRIRKLQATVEELENKVLALQLQVQRLSDGNKEAKAKADANLALIKALAQRLQPQ